MIAETAAEAVERREPTHRRRKGERAAWARSSSSLSLAGGRVAQRRKIPMISPTSTNPKVTEVGDYIFRVCFIDPFQGKVMATFARRESQARPRSRS